MNVLKVSLRTGTISLESFTGIGEDKLAKNQFDSIINSVLYQES